MNQSQKITAAIRLLKPSAEFSFINEDYSTIQWDVLEGKAPTPEQIAEAITQIEANELAKIESIAAIKATVLDRLGITEEEAKALLS